MGQLTHNQKRTDVKEQGGNAVSDYRPGFELTMTKKLNPFAYIVIGSLYTIGVIFTTSLFLKPDHPKKGFSYSEQKIKEEILKEIRSMKSAPAVVVKDSYNKELDHHLKKFRSNLIDEVNKMNLQYAEMIEKNTNERNKLVTDIVDRKPASIKMKEGEAIAYNETNRKILSFKHRKEYKRAKASYNKKRDEFIKSLDLKNPHDIEKLKDFEDDMELALYELKQQQRAIQKTFKDKRYIIVGK